MCWLRANESPGSRRGVSDYFLSPIAFNGDSKREDYCLHVFSGVLLDGASLKSVLQSVGERDC
jgi:hypothetical protein